MSKDLEQNDLEEILHEYAVLAASLYSLTDKNGGTSNLDVLQVNFSENVTFKLEYPDGSRWALRIHRIDYHSLQAIESELAWVSAMREQQVVVTPAPIAGLNGELVQVVSSPMLTKSRFAVLFEWEAGQQPSVTDGLEAYFEVLGQVTAKMHCHSQQWIQPANFERLTWDFETAMAGPTPHWGHWSAFSHLGDEQIAIFEKAQDLLGRKLGEYSCNQDNFGLVHGDMRLANLLVHDSQVTVIDFDDCGFSWFLYDAATSVSFFEDSPQVPSLMSAWVAGYRSVRDLDQSHVDMLPTFIIFRRLILVAWIASHSETQLAQSMGQEFVNNSAKLCEQYLQENL